ncbi:hypothetical protein H4S14_004170 [Agrobacterium vitis]|nr:hypothetical protein [Agrobacterium vitis]MBE1440396.1 hypothetical protein [Agrobacterium vitis]
MQTILTLVALIATVAIFVGLFYLIFRKGKRRQGLFIVIASFVVMVVSAGLLSKQQATDAGFESAADMKLAKDAGISDPKEFEARRAQIEADAKAKAEAQAAERQAKADAANAEAAKLAAEKAAAKAQAEARVAEQEAFYAPPAAQIAFVAAIEKARVDMKSANNDLAKGGVRRDRAKALCAAQKAPVIENWTGTLENLTTNSDGLGVVKVKIGEDAYVMTMNNAFSDMMAKTMIDPDTALFKQLAALKENDRIKFSGRFIASSTNTDCHWESSVTLEGSMASPEFVFRFSSVSTMP